MTENISYSEEKKEFYGENFNIKLCPDPRQDGTKWVPRILLSIPSSNITVQYISDFNNECDNEEEAYEASKKIAIAVIKEKGLI
jgi:hypothetical protein